MRPIAAILMPILLFFMGAAEGKPTHKVIEVDGVDRHYIVSTPEKLSGRHPLLLVLHGGPGTAADTSKYGFDRLCAERGFIVVYPQGYRKGWHIPKRPPVPKVPMQDEVKFIDALLDDLESRFPVDSSRIYVAGISNGGMFAHLLGSLRSDRFAAIVSIIGGMPEVVSKEFRPSEPIPVLMIRGTLDPILPYEGGNIKFPNREGDIFLSASATFQKWADHNGCRELQTKRLRDVVDDGCRVDRLSYADCSRGAEVILYKMNGAGHTFAGLTDHPMKWVLGRVCFDIDVVSLTGAFCSRQSKNKLR